MATILHSTYKICTMQSPHFDLLQRKGLIITLSHYKLVKNMIYLALKDYAPQKQTSDILTIKFNQEMMNI